MPVYVIGDTTYGKNVGSTTITDVNRSTWAIQPIVLRLTNSLGKSDYSHGFIPNSTIVEDFANLLALGSTSEPLLKKAMEYITGTVSSKSAASLKSVQMGIRKIADRKDMIPHSKEMYLPAKRFKNRS
jgi:spore maturation protein SpmA